MTANKNENTERPHVGNLTDFAYGVNENNPLHIEVAVDETGKVVVFHNKPFKCDISWYEYDISTSKLSFIMDEGEVRNLGMTLAPVISKNMQNSHQILTVLLDDETGEAKEGHYVPLIIHQQ